MCLICAWCLPLCENSPRSMLRQSFLNLHVYSNNLRIWFKTVDSDSVELGGPEILYFWQVPSWCRYILSKDHILSSELLKDFTISIPLFPGFLSCQPYCVSIPYSDSCLLCVSNLLPCLSGLYFAHLCWLFWYFGLLCPLTSYSTLLCYCPLE